MERRTPMNLTETHIETLRESWALAEPKSAALITRFYEILFERAPEKAAMFAGTARKVYRVSA